MSFSSLISKQLSSSSGFKRHRRRRRHCCCNGIELGNCCWCCRLPWSYVWRTIERVGGFVQLQNERRQSQKEWNIFLYFFITTAGEQQHSLCFGVWLLIHFVYSYNSFFVFILTEAGAVLFRKFILTFRRNVVTDRCMDGWMPLSRRNGCGRFLGEPSSSSSSWAAATLLLSDHWI